MQPTLSAAQRRTTTRLGREHARMTASVPRPAHDTRLRLVTLRARGIEAEFGEGLSSVLVEPGACARVAQTIAGAVIGPRDVDVDGAIDIAGQLVSLRTLPAPLLRPSATPTVDRAMLDDLWREICAQRRARVEAAHSSRRLLGYRSAAALDTAQRRAAEVDAELQAPLAEPEPEPTPEPVVDHIAPRLVALCDAIEALDPVASPEALALADAFDELAASLAAAPVEAPPADFSVLEARVAAARRNAAQIGGFVGGDARARIESCHRAVVDAEAALFESRRKDRPTALTAYQQAIAAERAALTQAGVDSYAAFLVTIAQGGASTDLAARLRAELDLADAESALRQARAQAAPSSTDPPLEERTLELRARAAQLLGRFPGDDPATELRALLVPNPDRAGPEKELRELLDELGEHVAENALITQARAVAAARMAEAAELAAPSPVAPRAPVVDRDELVEEKRALEEEIGALMKDCADHHEAMTVLERDLAYLDRVSALDLDTVEPEGLDAIVDALFGSYRDGDLMAGRLPLLLEGALDGLDSARLDALVDRLAAVDDIQVVVIAGDGRVADALDRVGAHRVAWSPPPVAVVPAVPRAEPAPATVAVTEVVATDAETAVKCSVHADKDSAATCSQCGRPSCVDCLVYLPDDSDLACRTCAEAMHGRTLRLLRRRGA